MSKIELLFGRTRLAFVVVVTTLVRQDDSLIIICMVLERETPTAHAAGSDGEAQGPRERGGKTVRRLSVRVEDASELALGNRFSWKGKPPGDVNNGVNPRPAAPSAFPPSTHRHRQMPPLAIRLPSSVRHPPNSFSPSPPYHVHDSDTTEQIPSYSFRLIREEVRESSNTPSHITASSHHPSHIGWRWHLPLWLLFFGVTVSILTLLFLLTGTVYPIPGWWTRYGSHSLGVLKMAGDICRDGHLPSAINNDTMSQPLVPVSHVGPRRVFARSTSNGDIAIMGPTIMRRPSTSGPASLVDKTVRVDRSVAVAHSLTLYVISLLMLSAFRARPGPHPRHTT